MTQLACTCTSRLLRAALVAAGCSGLLLALAPRPSWGVDPVRLDWDLRVMEDVLASLCRHGGAAPAGVEPVCRAVHIEGYGVVFLLANCPAQAWAGPPVAGLQPAAPGVAAAAHRLALEFLSRYAAGLDELDADECVTVIISPAVDAPLAVPPLPVGADVPGWAVVPVPPTSARSSDEVRGLGGDIALAVWRLLRAPVPGDTAGAQATARSAPALGETDHAGVAVGMGGRAAPSVHSASVARRDLDELQRGRIDAEQLHSRVRFWQLDPAAAACRSVAIMAQILETGLSGAGRGGLQFTVAGAYQPGLGALFCASPAPHLGPAGPLAGSDAAAPGIGGAAIEADLADLLVRYGPALAGLQDGEQVVAEVALPPGRVLARADWRALAGAAPNQAAAEALRRAISIERR